MPTINIPEEEYKSRVQHVRDCFANYIRMTDVDAANGKTKTYEELIKQLHGLDFAYTEPSNLMALPKTSTPTTSTE
nr:MAG TPA: hypothetical protein [Caudoviricetes sp.]